MVLSMRRLVRTQCGGRIMQLFLSDHLGIVLAFQRCRSNHFGVLTQSRHFQSYCVALCIRAYHRWIPLSSMRADVAPARLQSKTQSWGHIFWMTSTANCTVSVSNFLRPPPFEHRVNGVEKSDNSPSAMVSSSFEHERFCTRSSFENCEQQSYCNEGATSIPPSSIKWKPHVVLCE